VVPRLAAHRELLHKGQRVASHPRSVVKYAYSTIPEHRPASHRAHLEWTPSRLIHWDRTIGPPHGGPGRARDPQQAAPEQGYRSALGILRLANKHGDARLERACDKAIQINSPCYKTVKTMLAQRMEAVPLRDGDAAAAADSGHLGAGMSAAPATTTEFTATLQERRHEQPLSPSRSYDFTTSPILPENH